MASPLRVLLAEDSVADAELVVRELRRAGFAPEAVRVDTEAGFLEQLHSEFDVILSDYDMPQFSGIRALELFQEKTLEIPFIIISGTIGEEIAVQVMRLGASDYLLKDRLTRLGPAIRNALEQTEERRSRLRAEQSLRENAAFIDDVLNSLTAEVVVMSESGEITATNEAWNRFSRGHGASGFLGQNYLAMCEQSARRFGEADGLAASAGIRSVLDGSAAAFRMEYPCHTLAVERWFEMGVSPLRGARSGVVITHEEITGRKQAEEALRLFRTLVDQSNDTFEIIDPPTGRFLDVNAKGSAELGYRREEHLALHLWDVEMTVTSSGWPKLSASMQSAGSGSGEGLHRRKDGTTFPIEFNAKWVRLDRDYIVTVVRDITERKRAEAMLRQTEERLYTVVENLSEGLVISDLDGQLLHWNPAALRMHGFTTLDKGSAKPPSFRDIFEFSTLDGAVLPPEWWPLARICRGESLRGVEVRIRRLIGNWRRVFSYGGSIVQDEEDAPLAFMTIADVTERRQAEEALRDLTEQLQLALQVSRMGVWRSDLRSGDLTTIQGGGPISGLPEEISPSSTEAFLALIHPADRPGVVARLRQATETGEPYDSEFRIVLPDGSPRWVSAQGRCTRDPAGKPAVMIGVDLDITERKMAEAALREAKETLEGKVAERTAELQSAKERAESADKLKSQFLANMSHELRTPLNGVLGFTEFLIDEKAGSINARQKEYLTDVHNSGSHLLQLINDVLDLAKVESGQDNLRVSTFSPGKAIEEVCAVVKGIANKKRVELAARVAPELSAVSLDEKKFKQICYNLISNAVKFTDAGGRVSLEAGAPVAGWFNFRVTDTGIGIKAEDLPRLFHEFEQLETGTARRYEGTGLGLALTKRLVEMHGGQISVESLFGVGSTFQVRLPVRLPEFAAGSSAEPATGAKESDG
jgi:PAS domain S-box-containing protein